MPWSEGILMTEKAMCLLLVLGAEKAKASLVAQLVKNPPVRWETWVWSLGWEDPLEKRKDTYSSILAWRIPWTIQSKGPKRVRQDWATFTFTLLLSKNPQGGARPRVGHRACVDWKGTGLRRVFSNWRVTIYYYPTDFIWWMIIPLKKLKKI